MNLQRIIMAGGRPREHDREQIAKDLIEWASREDSTNLCGFCGYYDPPIDPNKLILFSKEDPQFRIAYDIAKSRIGLRRERLLSEGKLHCKAYDVNKNVYDHFAKDEHREQQAYEAKLSKEVASTSNPETNSQFQALMSLLEGLQSTSKTDCTNSNTDTKS